MGLAIQYKNSAQFTYEKECYLCVYLKYENQQKKNKYKMLTINEEGWNHKNENTM